MVRRCAFRTAHNVSKYLLTNCMPLFLEIFARILYNITKLIINNDAKCDTVFLDVHRVLNIPQIATFHHLYKLVSIERHLE